VSKPYISYGGGRNSTAMTILILTDDRFKDLREGLRIVFADTGAEMPETICYVNYFSNWLKANYGLGIEIVRNPKELLIEKCQRLGIVPVRRPRWCTVDFKIKPINQWAEQNGLTIPLIGIDAGEAHRIGGMHNPANRYPLIEADVDLAGCIEIIKSAGLEVPKKSGCFFCPHANKARFEDLLTYRPDLFELACSLEENAKRFGEGRYLKDKPLREWIATAGFELEEPCVVCELA
jgi:hypothetical protein